MSGAASNILKEHGFGIIVLIFVLILAFLMLLIVCRMFCVLQCGSSNQRNSVQHNRIEMPGFLSQQGRTVNFGDIFGGSQRSLSSEEIPLQAEVLQESPIRLDLPCRPRSVQGLEAVMQSLPEDPKPPTSPKTKIPHRMFNVKVVENAKNSSSQNRSAPEPEINTLRASTSASNANSLREPNSRDNANSLREPNSRDNANSLREPNSRDKANSLREPNSQPSSKPLEKSDSQPNIKTSQQLQLPDCTDLKNRADYNPYTPPLWDFEIEPHQ